ncbi:hypothetical protein O181_028525 [Austropuccinia psidii MF-1]|uniref:Integrase catalytic domain-containing protein n=1 Tax=Austropuccinia psidii MF-1 TaxID=1389203 RepID=A0A9Q3CTH5_9BASI|nr:hypothetical protein [Austropuccinia psidii MF-1]
MTTLNIPVWGGSVVIQDVPFSNKISGTILSVGRLCRASVVPLFSNVKLSLLVNHVVVTTTFFNNCWWLNFVQKEGKNVSAAVTPLSCLIEMNPIFPPFSMSLSLRKWHERLGHACDKVVISFLKKHVPAFDTKQWKPFFCEVCARVKSTHWLARARADIPKEKPLDLLVCNIMGPFNTDAQGFHYILTIRDHTSTYSIVYPLKSRSEAPQAIINCITQLQVRLRLTPKALRTNSAREFTSSTFAGSLSQMGVSFVPSLPCSPRENGEVDPLNRTLGDMARAMITQSGIPTRFWHYMCASACYIHNCIPNSQSSDSSPYQKLFGRAPAITTLYPFGAEAIVHLPATHQVHKLAPRGIRCKLLKPLMMGGWLLWDSETNRLIQLASVIFTQFQPERVFAGQVKKGTLPHILNVMSLREMKQRDVWEVINKTPGMALIGHRWVLDIKRHSDGTVQRFKARMVAHGDCQRPGVDCMEMYAPTALLMLLRLILATACLNRWQVALFDVSGAYLYSPLEEMVLLVPPTVFLPHLQWKVLQ